MITTLFADEKRSYLDVNMTIRVTFADKVHPLFDRNRAKIAQDFIASLMETCARSIHDTQQITLEGQTIYLEIDAIPFMEDDVDLGINLALGAGKADETQANVIWLGPKPPT